MTKAEWAKHHEIDDETMDKLTDLIKTFNAVITRVNIEPRKDGRKTWYN